MVKRTKMVKKMKKQKKEKPAILDRETKI